MDGIYKGEQELEEVLSDNSMHVRGTSESERRKNGESVVFINGPASCKLAVRRDPHA